MYAVILYEYEATLTETTSYKEIKRRIVMQGYPTIYTLYLVYRSKITVLF